MSKPISLQDICPEDGSFTLSDGRTYTVRKFTLQDQAWVQKTFSGQDNLTDAFKDPENLIRVVFHQLPVEQQKEFTPVEVERVDEDSGEIVTERLGGWRRFASTITNGPVDLTEMAKALTTAMVGSSAVVDEVEKPKKKTQQNLSRTGGPSLTSSPQSTVGASQLSGA